MKHKSGANHGEFTLPEIEKQTREWTWKKQITIGILGCHGSRQALPACRHPGSGHAGYYVYLVESVANSRGSDVPIGQDLSHKRLAAM